MVSAPNSRPMYASVLLPTDGSEASNEAVAVGLDVAARFDAAAHAVYVVDERFVAAEYDAAVEGAERDGERALDAVGDLAAERGVAVEKHLRRGVPHREIVDAVADYGADLVVMGTHGRSGLDRLVHLGSTTERVVRAAPVQVLTVPVDSTRDRSRSE